MPDSELFLVNHDEANVMSFIKHNTVAGLKKNHPAIASMLSRVYALFLWQANRKIVCNSKSGNAENIEFFSVLNNGCINKSQIRERVSRGDIIIARNLVQSLGMLDFFENFFSETYGINIDELGDVHIKHDIEKLLSLTALAKNHMDVKVLACSILESLFSQENELFAELMPNLRPHVPYEELRSKERQIESKIGRGKMNPHGPHKDSWRFHPKNTINVWVALSEVDKLNGMFILPKSADYYPKYADNEIVYGCSVYPEKQYVTELNFGDTVIFSAELLHGSVINQTDKTRFALSIRCALEKPNFHKSFMYNYVRVTPEFNNLSYEKLFCKSTFIPPSRDDYDKALGDTQLKLDVVEYDNKKMKVKINGELKEYPRRCPHKGADLLNGFVDNDCVVCPIHQQRVKSIS